MLQDFSPQVLDRSEIRRTIIWPEENQKKKRQKPKPTKPFGRRILSFWHVLNIIAMIVTDPVDGRNPAITSWHGKYPIIYRVSYISGVTIIDIINIMMMMVVAAAHVLAILKITPSKKILWLNHQSPNLPGTQSIGGSLGCYIPKFTQIECNAFLMSFRRAISIQLR